MKKFIYILNIFLIVLIPTTVFVSGGDITTHYEANTVASIKMIKTTVLLDRSNKKQEEREQEEKRKQEEEAKRILEEREKEEAAKRLAAITKPVKVSAQVGSLASSNGASDATSNSHPSNTSNNSSNVGNSTTVTFQPSTEVYVGAKLTGSMSAYGTDCCSSDPAKQGITSSGYNIKQKGMYYDDATYGKVRILAADDNFIFYSIIKINDPIDGEYYAIILDTGDKNIGIGRKFMFDLVVESQEWARKYYGIHRNITFEVLRIGK